MCCDFFLLIYCMHLCFVFYFIFSFTPLVDVLCDHFGVLVLATTWLVPVPVTPCTGRMYDHTIDLAWHCMCVNQINRQLQHCDNSTTKNHHHLHCGMFGIPCMNLLMWIPMTMISIITTMCEPFHH